MDAPAENCTGPQCAWAADWLTNWVDLSAVDWSSDRELNKASCPWAANMNTNTNKKAKGGKQSDTLGKMSPMAEPDLEDEDENDDDDEIRFTAPKVISKVLPTTTWYDSAGGRTLTPVRKDAETVSRLRLCVFASLRSSSRHPGGPSRMFRRPILPRWVCMQFICLALA